MKKYYITFALLLFPIANVIGQETLEEITLVQRDMSIPFYKVIDGYVKQRGEAAEKEIKVALALNDRTEAVWVDYILDVVGNRHDFYEERYDGYKVYGARCSLHFKDGIATSITGNFVTLQDLDTKICIAAKEAIAKAKQAMEKMGYADVESSSDTEMYVYVYKGVATLTYRLFMYASKQDVYYQAFVSAITGEVLSLESIAYNGRANTLHYGQQDISTTRGVSGYYELQDSDRNVITKFNGYIVSDEDDCWTESSYWTSGVAACCEAHYAMCCSYDYFYDTFGRDGYDDTHGIISCNVLSGYDNASFNWLENKFKFGIYGSLYFEALDIVAHEFGHAIFVYSIGQCNPTEEEGAAINEGMSDVWGACVENAYFPNSTDVWKMCEVINNASLWRSLSSPKTYSYPDTYCGTYWDSDNADSHKNSTVFSHWFYLLSSGGTGQNDNGDYYNVNGIGMSSAASICYQALRAYFCSNINFQSARSSTLLAAADLYGEYSDEYIQTLNAWHAVGVGDPIQITNNHLQVCQTETFTINVPCDYVTWSVYPSSLSYCVSSNRCIVTVPTGISQGTGYVVATINGVRSYTKFFEIGDFVPDMAYAYHGTNGSSENLSLSSASNYIQFEFDSGYYTEEELSDLEYGTRLVNVDTGGITYIGSICGSGLARLNNIPSVVGSYDVEVQGPCSDDWIYIWTIEVTR